MTHRVRLPRVGDCDVSPCRCIFNFGVGEIDTGSTVGGLYLFYFLLSQYMTDILLAHVIRSIGLDSS